MTDAVILFPGSRLPLRTLAGLREELTPAGAPEVARTVNGRPIVLPMPYGRLWSVRLSSDGERRTSLPVDDLVVGDTVEYWTAQRFSRVLAPGTTSVELARPPVDYSLHARDVETDEPVEIALQGTTVTLFGRSGWTEVSSRHRLTCMVSAIGTLSTDVVGRRSASVLELEEFPS